MMKKTRLNIGKNVKRLREAVGLTVTQLAKKCKMSQPQISRIEANDQGLRSGTALKIAKALGVKPWALFMTSEECDTVKEHLDFYVKKTIF